MVLITIEGIDGCGKSTLTSSLKETLTDTNPVFTREPGATWIGKLVRRGIAEEIDPIAEALLFVADHAAHLEQVIRPALLDGRLIISDRYSDSRYAYQTVTLSEHLADPFAWLRAVHGSWSIRPDRTFLLVLPVEEAVRRLSASPHLEHFEQAEILEQVQHNYLQLAASDPERFVIIDAMKKKEEILEFVETEIRRCAGSLRSPRRPD